MDVNLIAPELRSRARWFPTLKKQNRFSRWLGRKITRMMPSSTAAGVTIEERKSAPLLRLYRPDQPRNNAALLWIHGGGFMMGAPVMDDHLCAQTCQSLGILVASVDYRLAPEHPFPAPMDDAFAAWQWMQANAISLGIDARRIAVGGQSAGGGIAAGLVQRIHDSGDRRALAQWLFCPMLDDRTVNRHELDAIKHRIWSNESNMIGWKAYLGTTPGETEAPDYAVPARRADLTGLPPAWIGVGDIDLFYDEDRNYAEQLTHAGVNVTFVEVAGAPHGFESWARKTAVSRNFLQDARRWLGRMIDTPL
jgi:acetyl esterase/lipase